MVLVLVFLVLVFWRRHRGLPLLPCQQSAAADTKLVRVFSDLLPIAETTSSENLLDKPVVLIHGFSGAEAAGSSLSLLELGPLTPRTVTASVFAVNILKGLGLIPVEQLSLGQHLESGVDYDVYIGTWISVICRVICIKLHNLDTIPAATMAGLVKAAESLRSLQHERLLRFFGICQPDRTDSGSAQLWLVTELGPVSLRSTLQGRRSKSPIDPALAIRILHGVLEALAYLHASGHAHLDLKPENVLLHGGTQVQLSDYGIPGVLRELGAHVRADALVGGGTHGYRAPEQISGGERAGVSAASDMFAFAMIAVELLTGERPLADRTPMQLAYNLLVEQSDIELPASLPSEWRSVLRRCVTLDPSERPAASEVLREVAGV
jgi:serine/threonine protein kinase